MPCPFIKAWSGRCNRPVPKGATTCQEHKLTCSSCGAQATHECDETGQFVCGAPLCDNCEHTIFGNGTNGGIGFYAQNPPAGMKAHCKKSEQIFKPWYERS